MPTLSVILILISSQFVLAEPAFAPFNKFPDGRHDIQWSGDSLLPIVNPANEWTVEHYELGAATRRKYRFSPDAILSNGHYYYELKYDDSLMGPRTTGQYYREENGIVYTSVGNVVYDLNLGVTDTLPSNQVANQGTRTVMAVGTVTYNDNLPRKTLTVECTTGPFDQITVVEGIGDLVEFFHSEVMCINPLDGETNLIACYSVNGEIVYMKPGESCELSATTHRGVQPAAVYPNPATDRLYIEIPSNLAELAYQVRIYNVLGICMANQNLSTNSDLLSVAVSGLYPGSYWGLAQSDNGKIFSFAFVRIND